jgi:chromosomal replication initiator protein
LSFARFLPAPENRSALLALEHLVDCLCSGAHQRLPIPLFLHGPVGAGKTHLARGLATEMARRMPRLTCSVLDADEFEAITRGEDLEALPSCKEADLLVVEDVQRLGTAGSQAAVEALAQVVDYRASHQLATVLFANDGPARLSHLSSRFASRLAGGLAVELEPLQTESRLKFLQEKAQRRQLAVRPEVLAWLAEHVTGGGRQLEGALNQLVTLSRLHDRLPSLEDVARHFQEQAAVSRLTVDRIAEHVGRYFRIDPRHLQSRRRYQNVLVPRQVGMYLARQLTELSLQQIGSYFGGRDHSTVLHACRKIGQQLDQDVVLCGAVRQLTADLK